MRIKNNTCADVLRRRRLCPELADCTNTLLREIRNPEFKQMSVAVTYALAILSSEKVDWKKVNSAIIKRWSRSGLERIKRLAWSGKCFAKEN